MAKGSATAQRAGWLPGEAKPGKMDRVPEISNKLHNWNKFNPRAYAAKNYKTLRDDDRQIIEQLGKFFALRIPPEDAHGVDVGAGSNLYPTFGMLPFCKEVDLLEYSRPNVRWLKWKRLTLWMRIDRRWDPFWETYLTHPVFRKHAKGRRPYRSLLRKARVRQESVFELPSHRYDIGTMFFVACSLSTNIDDFYSAVASFGRCLKPGAPFAIAFMTNSDGYHAGKRWFPAVRIGQDEIAQSLKDIDPDAEIQEIDTRDPLRTGVGMVLATGTKTH